MRRYTTELRTVATEHSRAVSLILSRLRKTGHCLIVHHQIYRDEQGQWCIASREDELVYSSPLALEAVTQLVMMEGQRTVISVLDRQEKTKWETTLVSR